MAESKWKRVIMRQEAAVGRLERAHLISHTVLPGCALQNLLQSCGEAT